MTHKINMSVRNNLPRLTAGLAGLALLVLFVSCSNKSMTKRPPTDEELGRRPTVTAFPFDLQVEPGDQRMNVRWKKGGGGLYSGYNIYIGEKPGARQSAGSAASDSATPYNVGPYPGDTNPDDSIETFEADHLENGKKYYVIVRVILPDGTLSKPSNEVITVCGPRGEVTLKQRYSGDHDGFSLDQNAYVKADAPANDLYYFAKDGTDYLGSPKRLNGYLRGSQFAHLNLPGELKDIAPALAQANPNPTDEKLTIKAGEWVLIRTADNKNAVARVLGFEGSGENRQVRLFVAYCPLAGELLF